MKDKTITVDTGFYKKTVNKEQYVKRWLNHVKEIGLIVDNKNYKQVEKLINFRWFVKELAEKEFDETYKLQNKKEAV